MAKICDRIQSPNEDFTVLVKRKTDRDFKRLDSQELEPKQSDFQDTRSLDGIDIYNRHFDDENLKDIKYSEDLKDKENGRLKD